MTSSSTEISDDSIISIEDVSVEEDSHFCSKSPSLASCVNAYGLLERSSWQTSVARPCSVRIVSSKPIDL